MKLQPRTFAAVVTICAGALLPGAAGSAQSPDASPAVPPTPCPAMDSAGSPLREPGAIVTQGFASQDPAFPNTDPAFTGRFHPGDDLGTAGDPAGTPVSPIGSGRVIAVGPIDAGGRGGIVVLEHPGPFLVPASTPGAPYIYPAVETETILSAYEGIDPSPDLVVGTCVGPDTQLGVITAQCAPGVAAPCSDRPASLHLEIRLPATADPAMRSADWSVVGAQADSSAGTFFDPQVMVDDGLREPSTFIDSLAVPCPGASPGADGSPGSSLAPCPGSYPQVTPPPTPQPTPSPAPTRTPKPIRSPAADLLAGIPAKVRDTCVPRTSGLVTGTLAAVDCHPDSRRIKLLSYFLLRPADARFTFASRMRQYDLQAGADCHAGTPGIESSRSSLSIGCFVDANGRANLRFASRAACPAVYVGVLGTGGDIATLAKAYDQAVGAQWQDPGSSLAACRSKGSGVSAPPAPTNVVFKVHAPTDPKLYEKRVPPYRLEVTWDEAVEADTTIEVWGVTVCPSEAKGGDGGPCLTGKTPLPASIRRLQARAPAGDGSVSWTVPGWEVIGGGVGLDSRGRALYGIAVRAVNSNGASPFVLAKGGIGEWCKDCTY